MRRSAVINKIINKAAFMRAVKKSALFLCMFILITLVMALSACSPAGMLSGAAATGVIAAAEERPVGTVVGDFALKLSVEKKLMEKKALFPKVSVEVIEGKVFLTGKLDSVEERIDATRRSWNVEGVKEVVNDIAIAEPVGVGEYTRDFMLATKLRTRLLSDVDVSAINYSIESSDRVLYIMGIARSEAELDRVINHARNVSGVRDVVNYVRIRAQILPGAVASPASQAPQTAPVTSAPLPPPA